MLATNEADRKPLVVTMGRRIASRRALLDMGGGELAALVGVSRERMSAIENDRSGDINTATLVKIAKALGVTETWILHGDAQAASAA
jgi:transcriptional regulator with XRE-family HTH domain